LKDTTCRVWNFEGKCLKVYEGHKGKNIWGLDISPSQEIMVFFLLFFYFPFSFFSKITNQN